jgi:hypothetical protein
MFSTAAFVVEIVSLKAILLNDVKDNLVAGIGLI